MTEEKEKSGSWLHLWLRSRGGSIAIGLTVIGLVWLGVGIVSSSGMKQEVVVERVGVVEELPPIPLTESKELEGPETLLWEKKGGAGDLAETLVLTPQQLAQAKEMLAAFEGKPLNELVQVYGVMQMAVVSVSPEDRPVFEFVLARLGVYIAELER